MPVGYKQGSGVQGSGISSSWGCGPPVKHEKVGGAGVPARHGHKGMLRKTHPTEEFSEQN